MQGALSGNLMDFQGTGGIKIEKLLRREILSIKIKKLYQIRSRE
jgi:uncharacterized membrane protein (UPF0182 family)